LKKLNYQKKRSGVILYIILLQFLIVLSFSCCTSDKNSNREIKDNDHASEWINRINIPNSTIKGVYTEEIPFFLIPDDRKYDYINRLEKMQFVELNGNDYLEITKKPLEKEYGLAIRAICTHLGGDFELRKNKDNEYYIHYWVMGSRVWEYNKAVLIIEADELPKEIFNGYTVVR
jgi:hypothetical protein